MEVEHEEPLVLSKLATVTGIEPVFFLLDREVCSQNTIRPILIDGNFTAAMRTTQSCLFAELVNCFFQTFSNLEFVLQSGSVAFFLCFRELFLNSLNRPFELVFKDAQI